MQCSICTKKITQGFTIYDENIESKQKEFIGYIICPECFFTKINGYITVNPIKQPKKDEKEGSLMDEPQCPICKAGILESEGSITLSCNNCDAIFDVVEMKIKSLKFDENSDVIESDSKYFTIKLKEI